MRNLKRSRLAFVCLLLTGCAGLIGVPDLTLEEDLDSGSDSGSNLNDGQSTDSTSFIDTKPTTPPSDATTDTTQPVLDSGGDSSTCDLSQLATDPLNCGRCGHSCLGSTCTAGLCDPTKLGIVSAGGTRFIAEHGDYVYASTFYRAFTGEQGIYRIPKAGGAAEKYVSIDYTEQVIVIGDTLYFLIDDYRFDDASDHTGGIWTCDLNGPSPCVPQILAIADNPNGLTGDNGMLYFHNFGSSDDENLYSHAIDAGDIDASPFVGDVVSETFLYFLWSNKGDLYSLGGNLPEGNERAYVSRYPTDGGGGTGEELSRYTNPNANPGGLTGTATALFYAAYDFNMTTGGVVRRIPRAGAPAGDTACTFNNGTERRPSGIYSDDTNVYWTNQGDFSSPYGNGSVAYCPAHGACCAAPNILWRGDGEPVAITADDKALYWIGYRSGEFWKVAKP